MKFYLIVAKGSKKGMPIPIDIDLFMVGSEAACQLRARNMPPRLCAIVTRAKERKVFIRDLDSGSSVLVNDSVVPPGEEWPLHAGDRLELGALHFMVQFREKPLLQKDLEEWAAKCLDVESERNLFEDDSLAMAPTTASEAAAGIIDKLAAQRGMVMGRLRIGREYGVTTVRFNDSNLVEESEIAFIKKELCDHLNHHNLKILIDCKNIARMSTSAIAMLRDFHRWLKPWGSKMALCRVRTDLREALAGMVEEKIPIFPDKPSAIWAEW